MGTPKETSHCVKEGRHKQPHIVLFHLCKTSRIDKSIETKIRLSVFPVEYGISFVGGKNVPKLIVVMVIKLCEYTKNHKSVHCKLVNIYIHIYTHTHIYIHMYMYVLVCYI